MQRREFIKNSTLFGTIAMLGGANSLFGDDNVTANSNNKTLEKTNDDFITLNNGLAMPLIGLGTFGLENEICESMVSEALKIGYRLIDTAQSYGNEKVIGKGISKSKIYRKDIFIVTKLNFKSYENTRNTVIKSLENLQTYYLDMVLLEWPLGNYYGAWRELEKLNKEGIVKSIGIANFEPDQYIDLVAHNEIIPAINQIETNLYNQQLNQKEWLSKKQIAQMAISPLGADLKNEILGELRLQYLAQKYSKTPSQIALRYLTQQNIVAVPKPSKIEELKENLEIFDFSLNENEMAELAKLNKKSQTNSNLHNPEFVEKMIFSEQ
ncbi:MAG: aldo/keto reductase [Campylobacter sp.]|nr:aldo/keto reductase [Campylobacter sp.]MBO7475918.1 aldo/keto reductase [Campylobacter sp.]